MTLAADLAPGGEYGWKGEKENARVSDPRPIRIHTMAAISIVQERALPYRGDIVWNYGLT